MKNIYVVYFIDFGGQWGLDWAYDNIEQAQKRAEALEEGNDGVVYAGYHTIGFGQNNSEK